MSNFKCQMTNQCQMTNVKSKKLEVGDGRWENKNKKLLNLTSHFSLPTSYS